MKSFCAIKCLSFFFFAQKWPQQVFVAFSFQTGAIFCLLSVRSCCLAHCVSNSWLLLWTEDEDRSWVVRTVGMLSSSFKPCFHWQWRLTPPDHTVAVKRDRSSSEKRPDCFPPPQFIELQQELEQPQQQTVHKSESPFRIFQKSLLNYLHLRPDWDKTNDEITAVV